MSFLNSLINPHTKTQTSSNPGSFLTGSHSSSTTLSGFKPRLTGSSTNPLNFAKASATSTHFSSLSSVLNKTPSPTAVAATTSSPLKLSPSLLPSETHSPLKLDFDLAALNHTSHVVDLTPMHTSTVPKPTLKPTTTALTQKPFTPDLYAPTKNPVNLTPSVITPSVKDLSHFFAPIPRGLIDNPLKPPRLVDTPKLPTLELGSIFDHLRTTGILNSRPPKIEIANRDPLSLDSTFSPPKPRGMDLSDGVDTVKSIGNFGRIVAGSGYLADTRLPLNYPLEVINTSTYGATTNSPNQQTRKNIEDRNKEYKKDEQNLEDRKRQKRSSEKSKMAEAFFKEKQEDSSSRIHATLLQNWEASRTQGIYLNELAQEKRPWSYAGMTYHQPVKAPQGPIAVST